MVPLALAASASAVLQIMTRHMSMSKSDATKNKASFDILYNHKSEIEDTLGISLIWDRGDNKKASCVSYPLEVGAV